MKRRRTEERLNHHQIWCPAACETIPESAAINTRPPIEEFELVVRRRRPRMMWRLGARVSRVRPTYWCLSNLFQNLLAFTKG
ncbi:hypothetical protein ES288_A08G097300v1 [Gossypium darwinii]|uniref:Uncharacterized protein n=1 Tax=Gossypium darwinii TaxID=34276 RepID=A0A5D2FJW6_GOSDA|nr:hypothetical protein ES288_A08G097300v1 [Gossypium darwinii]